jgi:GNAT superfamily N-acetyltransferase
MRKSWFRNYVESWSEDLTWSRSEMDAACGLLTAIAEANQGKVYSDVAIETRRESDHAIGSVRAALDAVARAHAERLRPPESPAYAAEVDGPDAGLPSLRPSRPVPKLNLNLATRRELEGLPTVGPVTARKILRLRDRRGGFGSVDELMEVDGLGRRELDRFRRMVFAGPAGPASSVSSGELSSFLEAPTWAAYVNLLVDGVRLSPTDAPAEPVQAITLRELGRALHTVESDPHAWLRSPGTLASVVLRRDEQRREADRVRAAAVDEPMDAALLDDADYLYFVGDLLYRARRSVRVIQFFMRYMADRTHPTDRLMSRLARAHERGLDVKVILDRDAEGDGVGSRVVNEEAYEHLRSKGVPVAWDTVERYTHTKLVVTDSEHVVLGSHNWTAGSFFAFDDTSVYLHSEALAAHYEAQFDALWRDYTGPV